MLSFSTSWGASFKEKKEVLSDSCLVISNEKKTKIIEQGKRVFVKVGERKVKGIYTYASDSTIYINDIEVSLLEIDMMAKSKTGKTVGMFFAQLPVSIVGFGIMALGGAYGDRLAAVGGAAIIGIGLTAATLESYRGKRYRAFKISSKKNPTKTRNWEFSVHRK